MSHPEKEPNLFDRAQNAFDNVEAWAGRTIPGWRHWFGESIKRTSSEDMDEGANDEFDPTVLEREDFLVLNRFYEFCDHFEMDDMCTKALSQASKSMNIIILKPKLVKLTHRESQHAETLIISDLNELNGSMNHLLELYIANMAYDIESQSNPLRMNSIMKEVAINLLDDITGIERAYDFIAYLRRRIVELKRGPILKQGSYKSDGVSIESRAADSDLEGYHTLEFEVHGLQLGAAQSASFKPSTINYGLINDEEAIVYAVQGAKFEGKTTWQILRIEKFFEVSKNALIKAYSQEEPYSRFITGGIIDDKAIEAYYRDRLAVGVMYDKYLRYKACKAHLKSIKSVEHQIEENKLEASKISKTLRQGIENKVKRLRGANVNGLVSLSFLLVLANRRGLKRIKITKDLFRRKHLELEGFGRGNDRFWKMAYSLSQMGEIFVEDGFGEQMKRSKVKLSERLDYEFEGIRVDFDDPEYIVIHLDGPIKNKRPQWDEFFEFIETNIDQLERAA